MRNIIQNRATKSAVLLFLITVSTVGGVFAAMRLVNMNQGSLVINPGDNSPDTVKVYGNGVTFVTYVSTVLLEPETDTFQFYLPAGALTDTLTVSGIDVEKVTSKEQGGSMLEKGDVITVYTDGMSYTGKFLGWDSMLLLEANNGTVMIPGDKITRIVLTEVVQVQGPRILVEVTTTSPPGEYTLRISYLMRGPTWKPIYFIDVGTASLECWAAIINVEDWNNFTLVLVSGGPHIVYAGPVWCDNGNLRIGYSLYGALDFSSVTTVDQYHEYTYTKRLSFENGTQVRLLLFNGSVSLSQEYYWTNGEVQNRYHIVNLLNEPLATGTVEFYRNQSWIGEDSIPYTPVKAESTATVNYASDVRINSTITKSVSEEHTQTQGITLTIKNYKETSITILVQQDINGYDLVTSTPAANRVGPILSWTIEVDAGSTQTIYYEWTHTW